jgi:hypothetical protein
LAHSVAERRVVQLWCGHDVPDNGCPAFARGEVEHGKTRSGGADGFESGCVPFGEDGHGFARLP